MPCYSRVTIAAQDAVKMDVEVKADFDALSQLKDAELVSDNILQINGLQWRKSGKTVRVDAKLDDKRVQQVIQAYGKQQIKQYAKAQGWTMSAGKTANQYVLRSY